MSLVDPPGSRRHFLRSSLSLLPVVTLGGCSVMYFTGYSCFYAAISEASFSHLVIWRAGSNVGSDSVLIWLLAYFFVS